MALNMEKKTGWLDHMLAQNEPEYDGLKMMAHRTEGIMLKMQEFMDLAAKDPEGLKKALSPEALKAVQDQLADYNVKLGQMSASINHLKGERSATLYYRRMYTYGFVEPV
jgi:hypothetical protein